MPTNELAVRLHDIAIELENEQKFYVTYNSLKAGAPDARKRREAIKLCTRRTKSAEEREHLRRYFDDVYAMPPANENVLRDVHDLKFWLDDVKYPGDNGLPPHLQSGTPFDVNFARGPNANDRERWGRYDKPWTDEELTHLKTLFWSGKDLTHICAAMMRPPNGVLNKLTETCCLKFDHFQLKYFVNKKTPFNSAVVVALSPVPDKAPLQEAAEHIDSAISHLTSVSNSLKEILMSKTEIIKIETKTFVNGVDISTMDDADVYALIATQEEQISTLDKIQTKPKKLKDEIEKRRAGIQALVDYLDSKSE